LLRNYIIVFRSAIDRKQSKAKHEAK